MPQLRDAARLHLSLLPSSWWGDFSTKESLSLKVSLFHLQLTGLFLTHDRPYRFPLVWFTLPTLLLERISRCRTRFHFCGPFFFKVFVAAIPAALLLMIPAETVKTETNAKWLSDGMQIGVSGCSRWLCHGYQRWRAVKYGHQFALAAVSQCCDRPWSSGAALALIYLTLSKKDWQWAILLTINWRHSRTIRERCDTIMTEKLQLSKSSSKVWWRSTFLPRFLEL